MTDSKQIPERIRSMRKALRLSQEELAEKSKLSISIISKIERNEVSNIHIATLEQITSGLGISLEAFFSSKTQNDILLEQLTRAIDALPERNRQKTVESILQILTAHQKEDDLS